MNSEKFLLTLKSELVLTLTKDSGWASEGSVLSFHSASTGASTHCALSIERGVTSWEGPSATPGPQTVEAGQKLDPHENKADSTPGPPQVGKSAPACVHSSTFLFVVSMISYFVFVLLAICSYFLHGLTFQVVGVCGLNTEGSDVEQTPFPLWEKFGKFLCC